MVQRVRATVEFKGALYSAAGTLSDARKIKAGEPKNAFVFTGYGNHHSLMICGLKMKITQTEAFMYDTELVSTDGKFQLSQINLSFFRNQDFSVYLPNTSIQENSSIPLVIKTLLIAYILP